MIAAITIGTAALFGIVAFSAARLFKEKVTLVLTGTIAGLSITTSLIYLITPLTSLSITTLLTASLLLVITTIILLRQTPAWHHWQSCSLDKTTLATLIVLIGLFSLIAPKLLIDTPTGLYTGVTNAYGDLGFHLSNITLLSENRALIPEDSIFAGQRLAYPFLSNFFSAMLLTSGVSLAQSVTIPALILIPLMLTLLYRLVHQLTASKRAALIALLLFLLAGSTLGWLRIHSDWITSHQSISEFLTHLPRNYSGHSADSDGYHMVNPIISLLLPQRAFLFGIPLALTILLLLLQAKTRGLPAFLSAGILAGLLPLFHAHTVLALIPVILALFIIRPNRGWLFFGVTALLVGLPGLLYFLTSPNTASAMPRFQFGWMAHDTNAVIFWIKNTGLLVPIAILGLLLPAKREVKAFAIAGLSIFLTANIWVFAAWEWDNTKLFVYWLLFTLPLLSWVIVYVLHSRFLIVRSTVVVLLILHLVSGSLDIYQLLRPDSPHWQEWNSDAIAMANHIRSLTPPGTAILAAPIHNSPVALSGRPAYLGFPAHVWSHGGAPEQREQGLQQFFAGTIDTLPDITPHYIHIGPAERYQYPSLYIRPNWSLVAQENQYQLYTY